MPDVVRLAGPHAEPVELWHSHVRVIRTSLVVQLGMLLVWCSSADPPRVWAKNKAFPGCSFTRSLGSAVAKRLGIVATPDITSYRLSPTDRWVLVTAPFALSKACMFARIQNCRPLIAQVVQRAHDLGYAQVSS
jgi:hypothetical protein